MRNGFSVRQHAAKERGLQEVSLTGYYFIIIVKSESLYQIHSNNFIHFIPHTKRIYDGQLLL